MKIHEVSRDKSIILNQKDLNMNNIYGMNGDKKKNLKLIGFE